MRVLCALPLAAALFASAPAPACAQGTTTADLDRARTLYNQGLEQEAAGQWAGALATFEDVARIKMTPQVRYHVARCKEHLGRLNEALGGYRLAEHEARATEKALDVLPEIEAALETLEARIPKLIVERGEGTDAATLELDGVVLGHAQIGKPVHVDPGPHRVRVVLPDRRTFQRTLYVKEGETQQVILDVPPDLQPESATGEDDAAAVADEDARPGAPDARVSGGASPWPWIALGVGAAGFVVAGVFHGQASEAEDELDLACRDRVCPDTVEDVQARGERQALIRDVSLGVGVVGVVAGVTLFVVGGSKQEGVSVRARGGAGFAGADATLRF